MDTMHGMKSLRLSEAAVNGPFHPLTGERLRPLGVRSDGRLIWPMMGGSETPPENDGGDDNPDDEGNKDPEGKDPDSKDSDKDPEGDPDAKIAALEDEKNRHVRRRQEAETERDKLKRELEELKGKDTPELDQLRTKVTNLESQNQSLEGSLRESRLQIAFLQDNTYQWHNPGRAMALADLSEVEIDSDGKVHGLKSALDKLAKSDAYLIKESSDDSKKQKTPPNTADPKNPSKKEKNKDESKKEEDKLLGKYAALRR